MENNRMTELQKKELEILKQFLAVCEKLNLTYYMVCGSALGAVKYGGFIPWDDDIDVALPRQDYERFCEEAPKMLPSWCFLQNYRTEKQYYRLGTKLRDSRTTYIEIMTENLNINQGVFIDVFPLDNKWSTQSEEKKFRRELRRFEAGRRVKLHYNRFSGSSILMVQTNICYLLFKLFGYRSDIAETIRRFDRYVSSFSADSGIWCNHANSTSPLEYAPKTQYGKGAWFPFEDLEVRVPERYNEYLTQKYGNWREDIPQDEQQGHHYYVKCDLNRSFNEYTADRRCLP